MSNQSKQEPGVIASLLKTAKQQLFGRRQTPPSFWRAYTRSGKIVIIQDRQVVDVIDPKQVPDK